MEVVIVVRVVILEVTGVVLGMQEPLHTIMLHTSREACTVVVMMLIVQGFRILGTVVTVPTMQEGMIKEGMVVQQQVVMAHLQLEVEEVLVEQDTAPTKTGRQAKWLRCINRRQSDLKQ